MRRWWLVIALLLSVGVNIGILATLATRQATRPDREPERRETPQPEQPRRAEPAPTPAPEIEEPEEEPRREQRLSPPPPPPPPGQDEPGEEPPEGDGPGDLPLPRAGRLADHLGLEGDQRRQFLEIQQRFFEETMRIRLQLGETQREVRRELVAAEPDRQRIQELLDASARDYLALEQALAKNVVASREVLTPEQEKEFLRIIARLRAPGPGGRMGPPQRRRPPPWRRLERRFPEDRPPPERQ